MGDDLPLFIYGNTHQTGGDHKNGNAVTQNAKETIMTTAERLRKEGLEQGALKKAREDANRMLDKGLPDRRYLRHHRPNTARGGRSAQIKNCERGEARACCQRSDGEAVNTARRDTFRYPLLMYAYFHHHQPEAISSSILRRSKNILRVMLHNTKIRINTAHELLHFFFESETYSGQFHCAAS